MKKAFILFLVFYHVDFLFAICVNSPKESDVLSEANSKTEDATIKMIVEKGDNSTPSSYYIPPEAYLFGMFEVISADHDESGAVSELKLIEIYGELTYIEIGAVIKAHEPYKSSQVEDSTVMTFDSNNLPVEIGTYLPFIEGKRYIVAIVPSPSVQHFQYFAAPAFDFLSESGYEDFDFVLSEKNDFEDSFDEESHINQTPDGDYKINVDNIKLIFESFEPHYDEGKKPDISEVINAIDEWVEKAKE